MTIVRHPISLPAVAREVGLIAVATLAYFGVRGFTEDRIDRAFDNADALLRLEGALGIDWERAFQEPLLDHQWLLTLTNWVYVYGHWPVIAACGIALYVWRHDRYVLLRNAMFISGLIGFIFFAGVPMAPPRMVDPGVVDTVTEYSEGYRALQPPALTNKYAAFPSLHVGWNLLLGIVLFQATTHRAVRAFAIAMPAAMAFAVVASANHFVLDVVAGAVVVLVGLALAKAWTYVQSSTRMNGRDAESGRPPRRPFVVAHRSGNSMLGVQTAEALGVQAIEADVHLYRGRLEVRHLKTLGPIPLLWDRWRLANPFRRRLVLAELLAAVDGRTVLVLDLKGRDPSMASEVAEALAPRRRVGGHTTVCARDWRLLEELVGVRGLRLVHSVGSVRQLRRLLRRHHGRRLEGVAIHERLLDSRTARELHELADVILTWPVNTLERAHELIRLEVEGLISDRPSLLHSAVGAEN